MNVACVLLLMTATAADVGVRTRWAIRTCVPHAIGCAPARTRTARCKGRGLGEMASRAERDRLYLTGC
eukprot:361313-Chlamydomonas_euryale.AAC.7